MADLIRTLEADLFGAYEWAADLYEDLKTVPEGADRLAAHRGLLRAYEALEGKAAESMKAAEGLVEAEEALDETERAVLAPLDAPRETFFADPNPETARAFLAAFDAVWDKQDFLVADALLAALARSNVLASRAKASLTPDEVRALHAQAARLYEDAYALLGFRVGGGSELWRETQQSTLFRAAAAWRLAGDEQKAKRASEIAGKPPGADELQNRGLRR